ncbi:unnamed protein product [Paramecium pentaurelia]|uniref:Transmembrane protein n=1 Tax=Paramecium pentaurelia TaxID=43138 RepID=A0A8S1YCG1_9CILI|nr:unnamed protein product [Paramecium pentaurelia]
MRSNFTLYNKLWKSIIFGLLIDIHVIFYCIKVQEQEIIQDLVRLMIRRQIEKKIIQISLFIVIYILYIINSIIKYDNYIMSFQYFIYYLFPFRIRSAIQYSILKYQTQYQIQQIYVKVIYIFNIHFLLDNRNNSTNLNRK